MNPGPPPRQGGALPLSYVPVSGVFDSLYLMTLSTDFYSGKCPSRALRQGKMSLRQEGVCILVSPRLERDMPTKVGDPRAGFLPSIEKTRRAEGEFMRHPYRRLDLGKGIFSVRIGIQRARPRALARAIHPVQYVPTWCPSFVRGDRGDLVRTPLVRAYTMFRHPSCPPFTKGGFWQYVCSGIRVRAPCRA